MWSKCNWILCPNSEHSPQSAGVIKAKTKSKRWDRNWTLFLHIWGHPCIWLKVHVTQTVSVLPLWVCLCFPSVSELFILSYRMTRLALLAPLLLLFIHSAVSQEAEDPAAPPPPPPGQASDGTQAEDQTEDWGLNSLRGSFESVGGYFDSVLEFMGGRDGVCQYRCRFGKSVKWTSKHYAVWLIWFRLRIIHNDMQPRDRAGDEPGPLR